MAEAGYLFEVVVILLAAVVTVSVFQRLKLGAVLGYLVAGALIGPAGLSLISEMETARTLAEFGVVFLLFTVGLELPFERIKLMRGRIFALGVGQVLVTTIVIAAVALLAGMSTVASAVVVGGALALSSTAIVLRLLVDRGELTSQFGRSAFAVLLVQDLLVGLFLVTVLALGQDDLSIGMALGLAALKVAVAMMAILGLGRIVLRHLFAQVAVTREPEIFAALTLFVVIATGLVTKLAGMSMAFGAFLAGMLLAETTYRHQVAAEIQPFRGLLLGLFFMTVGMSIDVTFALSNGGTVVLLVVGLLLGKAVLLFGLARLFGLPLAQALHLGLVLCQAGEFSFVLLGAGVAIGVVAPGVGQLLVVSVALTMMATPFLDRLGRLLAERVERRTVVGVEQAPEQTDRLSNHVVIAGFGRVGAAVAARLRAEKVPFIAVDLDPHLIHQARRLGEPVYYGDVSRAEILDAVHIERARALVVAMNNPKAALQLVALMNYIFPNLPVYARARDDAHAWELEQAGAHTVVPELVATGVKLASSIVEGALSEELFPDKPES
jgi:CPA2 family monovalent cation:H+ antiporter-2